MFRIVFCFLLVVVGFARVKARATRRDPIRSEKNQEKKEKETRRRHTQRDTHGVTSLVHSALLLWSRLP